MRCSEWVNSDEIVLNLKIFSSRNNVVKFLKREFWCKCFRTMNIYQTSPLFDRKGNLTPKKFTL